MEDAFVEGMALLKDYPVDDAGGIDAVLQTAYDLAVRRELEKQAAVQAGNAGLGARFRGTVWRNVATQPTHHSDSTESEESEEDEDEETYTQVNSPRGASTLSSRLANTVWKGITNQSAMEAPGTPTDTSTNHSPQPPVASLPSAPRPVENGSSTPAGPNLTKNIWGLR